VRTTFNVCVLLVAIFTVIMWAFHIGPNLTGRMGLVPVPLVETAITLGIGVTILFCYDRHALVRLLFIPFGMGLIAMVHGLLFFTDGSPDAAMYLDFGEFAGILFGTPLGLILFLISGVAIKRRP
jgi:hypothetical protein